MTENDLYWPTGFFNELVAMYESDSDEQFRSAKLGKMYRRAAEESVASAIADPRSAFSEEIGEQAGFEARLEARLGPRA